MKEVLGKDALGPIVDKINANVGKAMETHTINGKALSENPELKARDVGAAPVVDGKIPESYMPSWVDDMVDFHGIDDNFSGSGAPSGYTLEQPTAVICITGTFYAIGTDGLAYDKWKSYGDIKASEFYGTHDGSAGVIPVSGKVYLDTTTNKTYRWSGTQLALIGNDLALGETAATAYPGNKGKEVYDAVFTKNLPVVKPTMVIDYSATDQSGTPVDKPELKNNVVTIERGIKINFIVGFKWSPAEGYKNPVKITPNTAFSEFGLPAAGVDSEKISATQENAITITASLSAPKTGLMVDSAGNVTSASGDDTSSNKFQIALTYRRFMGAIPNGTAINESVIKGLASELNTGKGKTINVDISNAQQYVYAYEAALGEAGIAVGVEDQKDFWDTGTLTITNQYGKVITYRYYVCGAGAYKGVNVKFS